MTLLERLKARTGEANVALLTDLLESAKAAILVRRFPYGNGTEQLEVKYEDLQYRIALALYEKEGAGFQISHSENGISRGWKSEGVPESLLAEITPIVGSVK